MYAFLHLPDDPVLILLHLRTHQWDPERPICTSCGQTSGRPIVAPPGVCGPRLPGHRRLHPVHLAHLPAGQQRAAEDVYGERSLTAPLSRDERQGEVSTARVPLCKGLGLV